MKAYKFLRNDFRSGSGEEPPWHEGEKRVYEGEISLCETGYHSSPSFYDALTYAPGNVACIVEVSKPAQRQSDKYVSRECTIVKMVNAEKVLREWGIRCAERALKKTKVTDKRRWNVLKVVRLYNEGKATKEYLEAARLAEMSDVWLAAKEAAWSAARLATREAARLATREGEVTYQKRLLNKMIKGLISESTNKHPALKKKEEKKE